MKTYPKKNDAGETWAFEISNIFLSSKGMARFIGGCPGVKITRVRRMFDPNDEVHVEFDLNGEHYHVWEPYGDSSGLWIGPEEGQPFESIGHIEHYVAEHWPGPTSWGLAWLASLFRRGPA